ncbi:MAG: hypothetical protein E2O61_09420 [Gammaproteobacteria bacterium]|nr:MAG: hypothetical protein E2O61_09420 [Gammaproteobacteria bacterium]
MIVAISARARRVLGATLILVTAPSLVYAGIEAGNVLGIEAGNVTGIEAGNVLGIEAGNVTGIEAGNVLGIEAGNVSGAEQLAIVLMGPIHSINSLEGVFASMGQSVMATPEMLNALNVGDLVTVHGSISGPGWLYADSVTVSAEQYVAGATEVFVSGILSSIDVSTGTAMLGSLTVDYTSSLGSGQMPAGAVWSFRGTQPVSRGVMLSDEVHAY